MSSRLQSIRWHSHLSFKKAKHEKRKSSETCERQVIIDGEYQVREKEGNKNHELTKYRLYH